MFFAIIAAIAKNGVIGKDNKLPWHIPEDLARFYHLVRGKSVIMGRKTYESIGKPIPGSENIVLSHDRSLHLSGCKVVHSISEILALYKDYSAEVMVIGGAPIYEQFLSLADKMYLTLLDSEIDGDVYFPEWQQEEWLVVSEEHCQSSGYSYRFLVLQRKDHPR